MSLLVPYRVQGQVGLHDTLYKRKEGIKSSHLYIVPLNWLSQLPVTNPLDHVTAQPQAGDTYF